MLKKFKADYDFDEDLFFLFDEKNKSNSSVEFEDVIVDLEKNGQIVGLEFFNASKYLGDLTNKKITKEILKRITVADFSVVKRKGMIIIKIVLTIEKEQVPATIAIPSMDYKSPAIA